MLRLFGLETFFSRSALTIIFALATTLTVDLHADEPVHAVSEPSTQSTLPSLAVLTKDDILAYVDAARSSIEDLSVSFSFNERPSTRPSSSDEGFRDHATVVIKGSMIYIDRKYGADPTVNPRLFDREIAYNGHICTLNEKNRGIASARTGRLQECDTYDLGFFQLGLLNAPSTDHWDTDGCLSSQLRYGGSTLRKTLENVGQTPCYVLDVCKSSGDSRTLEETLWLNPTEGFLPVKVFYVKNSNVFMETYIDDAVKLGGELWFPVHGRKIVNLRISATHGKLTAVDEKAAAETILEVDGWKEGKPAVSVNTGIRDDYFDLWKHLPPGTLLIDEDTKTSTTVGGTDYKALADGIDTTLPRDRLLVPEAMGQGVLPSPPSQTRWSPALIFVVASAISMLCVFIGFYFRKRHQS